jgi:BirA family biotin operon repressor/biotin-[acetyl-CoA-carboxylase] ligase
VMSARVMLKLIIIMQFKKIYYEEIDSTSVRLEQMAREQAPEGTVIIAETQTKGKGQGHNYWVSNHGGLYFSILLRPGKNLPLLSLMTGVVLVETLKHFSPKEFFIKWPNDIIQNREKMAGILVESRYLGNKPEYMIVGCGININQEAFTEVKEYRATSLKLISGKSYQTADILNLFLENFQGLYTEYLKSGESIVLERFKPYLYLKGEIIKIKVYDDKVIEGKLTGISEEGGLVILNADNKYETIFSGRIQAQ